MRYMGIFLWFGGILYSIYLRGTVGSCHAAGLRLYGRYCSPAVELQCKYLHWAPMFITMNCTGRFGSLGYRSPCRPDVILVDSTCLGLFWRPKVCNHCSAYVSIFRPLFVSSCDTVLEATMVSSTTPRSRLHKSLASAWLPAIQTHHVFCPKFT